MPLPIKIASTIEIDGHEYVIVTMDVKASIVGRSIAIVALDKDSAEREQKKSIERDAVADAQTSVMRTVAKMIEDATDKGNGGGFNVGGY